MWIGSLCIIKAYFDVFKVFGYSKGNNRPRRDDCFLIGNYLFVFAYYFSFKYPNTAKKKEPQVKLEVLPKKGEWRDYFHKLKLIVKVILFAEGYRLY